jgi:hypothetical protein
MSLMRSLIRWYRSLAGWAADPECDDYHSRSNEQGDGVGDY